MTSTSNRGRRLPDFLGIGAPRSGTSWLYHNLRQHPRVWMPPVKELMFFNNPSRLPLITWLLRGQRLAWRALLSHMRTLRLESRDAEIMWHARFLLRPRTDAWYRSLFCPRPGQVTGDLTPGYGALPVDVVARIHALIPEAKLIYLLRDPIERVWSHAALRSYAHRQPGIDRISEEEMIRFLNSESLLSHGDYVDRLATWERYYPSRQIFVGFFDQLVQDPSALFKDVCGFIGVEASDRLVPAMVDLRRNARQYPAVPAPLRTALSRRYHDQLVRLHERFANAHTAAWLEAVHRALDRA